MTKRLVCADCGSETVASDSDRGRQRSFRWCKQCNTSKRGDDMYRMYTSCVCCDSDFDCWSMDGYCDACNDYGCSDPDYQFLWYCPREHEQTDPPDCDDHSFFKLAFEDGYECRHCGFTTNFAYANDDYGDTWDDAREEALQRDSEQCRVCGTTQEDHIDEYERELNVHHIKPLREFQNVEKAHSLSNLAVLCLECHRDLEWKPEQEQREILDLPRSEDLETDESETDPAEEGLLESERPELPVHDQDTCPNCGSDFSFVSSVLDPMPWDDNYVEGVDQSESFYTCDGCGTQWRSGMPGDDDE